MIDLTLMDRKQLWEALENSLVDNLLAPDADLDLLRAAVQQQLDQHDLNFWCDNPCCEHGRADHTVLVSVNRFGDESRNYCSSCEEIYSIGVRHGSMRESKA